MNLIKKLSNILLFLVSHFLMIDGCHSCGWKCNIRQYKKVVLYIYFFNHLARFYLNYIFVFLLLNGRKQQANFILFYTNFIFFYVFFRFTICLDRNWLRNNQNQMVFGQHGVLGHRALEVVVEESLNRPDIVFLDQQTQGKIYFLLSLYYFLHLH